MDDIPLETLLARVRGHTMTTRERREQRMSLVLGNAAVEGLRLHRGTVTMAVSRHPKTPRETLVTTAALEPPSVPFDVGGAVRQFNLVRTLVEDHLAGKTVQITPELLRKLHAALGDENSPHFGDFRRVPVAVRGSPHQPPPPVGLDKAIAAFCKHLTDRWSVDDAIALSAYALWRLNWIHPFLDGNGRTARALSYLVLNLKVGMWIPGSPTLLEQLQERRDEYFDALTAADLGFNDSGAANIGPLQTLLAALLERQLLSLPALSARGESQLAAIVTRRIGQVDPDTRERLFGADEVRHRGWSVGDYLLVHVGPRKALEQSEALFSTANQPFPGLLAAPHESAQLRITAKQRGAIVGPRIFEVTDTAGIWLESNATATVEQPAVMLRRPSTPPLDWQFQGALYVLRRGDEITDLWIYDVLDLLMMRHIQEAR